MQGDTDRKLCADCPCRTPLRPDPQTIQQARNLIFEPPLDEGIRHIVEVLVAGGIETYESCQGGNGHCYAEPTVRFEGALSEGLRATAVAIANGLPANALRRVWEVRDGMLHGPWWEITFSPPRPSNYDNR